MTFRNYSDSVCWKGKKNIKEPNSHEPIDKLVNVFAKQASFETFTVSKTKISGKRGIRGTLQRKKEKVFTSKCLSFQHLYMNAKMTRIVILGLSAKKKNVFVKEIQQEMGNTAEVIISHATYKSVGNRLIERTYLFSFIFHDYVPSVSE